MTRAERITVTVLAAFVLVYGLSQVAREMHLWRRVTPPEGIIEVGVVFLGLTTRDSIEVGRTVQARYANQCPIGRVP